MGVNVDPGTSGNALINVFSTGTVPINPVEKEAAGGDPIENLLPALLQIFLTVGLGWAAGASNVFNSKEARGLGLFVGKISLPALILTNLVCLDLSVIKWGFLLAVLVSKSIIFSLVLALDFLFNRNISRAALFAIYSTQTNDFGMGLPIMNAVYGPQDPMTGLIYLVAPISLLILNPIGFVLLEVDRKNKGGETEGGLKTVLAVLKGLLTNPVVSMTMLGVLGNLAFSSSPPPHLNTFFQSLGAAFSALAPFSLGLSMAGKLRGIKGEAIKPIVALVIVKSIVSPLLIYLLVGQLAPWIDNKPDPSISNFALLLGSFPAALGVASYSVEYRVATDLISAALVLGTLASAPMMYGIANTLTALSETPETLAKFEHTCIIVSCLLSISAVIIVLGLFLSRPVWQRPPHLLTTSLLILTLISSTAGLLHTLLLHPALALLHLTALHASRLSTPFLALHLLLLARSSPNAFSPITTALLLLSGPILSLPTLLLLLAPFSPKNSLAFGPQQEYMSLAIHTLALFPTLMLLLQTTRTPPAPLPERQVFRHTLLLTTLAAAMFTSIAIAAGRILLLSEITDSCFPGTFKVLISLNTVLSSGQGLLFLAVFGTDKASRLLGPFRSLSSFCQHSWGRRATMVDSFVMVNPPTESTEELTSTSKMKGREKKEVVKSSQVRVEEVVRLEKERRRHSEHGAASV